MDSPKVYVSSKLKHADKWRKLREDGLNIISSWIDLEVEESAVAALDLMWRGYIDEVKSSDFLILYAEPGEILKGALIEVGIAAALNIHIVAVGDKSCIKTFRYYNSVTELDTLEEAVEIIDRD